jgi:hypothetical protein
MKSSRIFPGGSCSGPKHLAIVFQSALVSDETVSKVLLLGRELVVQQVADSIDELKEVTHSPEPSLILSLRRE